MKPPVMLMGAALVFWGWQTGYLAAGLFMALVIEASNWVRRRWEFSPRDFHRLSDLCALIFLGMAVYRFAAGTASLARWIPMAVFPLLAAQVYSRIGGVDLGAIFYVIRQQEKRREVVPRRTVDIRYPVFVLTLLGASAANVRTPAFYLGVLCLGAWGLWPFRSVRYRVATWVTVVALAGGIGWGGQHCLHRLQVWLENAAIEWFAQREENPFRNTTAIGDIGDLKLHERIVMRVQTGSHKRSPGLFYQAGYNFYKDGLWIAARAAFSPVSPAGPNHRNWPLTGSATGGDRIRVATVLRNGRGLLALPRDTAAIEGLAAERVGRNRLGTIRVSGGPGLAVFTIRTRPSAARLSGPDAADMQMPPEEAAVVRGIASRLHLFGMTPAQSVRAIRRYFQTGFQYGLSQGKLAPGISPLGYFLTDSRTGHCEYFATATVLLLRAAGIPARYATGFLVHEYSPLENAFVVRLRHGHAWALAWLDGRWQPVDTTPAVWIEMESASAAVYQPVVDIFRFLSYRFDRWRWREDRAGVPDWLVWVAVLLTAVLVWRVFARKRAVVERSPEPAGAASGLPMPPPRSPFDDIERHLSRMGYGRQPWETAAEWVLRMEKAGADAAAAAGLRDLVDRHYRARFHPLGISENEERAFQRQVSIWLAAHDQEKSIFLVNPSHGAVHSGVETRR